MIEHANRGTLWWHHERWPELDRNAWLEVHRPGDDFDPPGPAAGWTDGSRRNVEHAYGRYLQFLRQSGSLHPADQVADRLDLNHIRLFARELATKVTPATVWGILQALYRAFSAMAPQADRTDFSKVLTRIKRRTPLSRNLKGRLIDTVALISVGNQMMDEADRRKMGAKAAVLYRNGAIVAGAAYLPMRLNSWAKIQIGRHLRLAEDRGWLSLEARELKATKRPYQAELPPEYVIRLKRYIAHYRPVLLQGKADCGALWLCWDGKPLQADALSAAVIAALARRCDKKFSFHMFRHASATFIENTVPERSLMAAGVLHHADFRMTQEHYIRGQRTAAMRGYQTCVRQIIRRGLTDQRRGARRRLRG
jgi:integrase